MANVLIVEDDPRLLDLLSRALGGEGYVIDHARDLAQARALLAQRRFDAIVLDRMLPDGDGAELCVELRRKRARTPVLLLTARGEVHDRVSGWQAGADNYLVKPFELEELLAVVARLVGRERENLYVDGSFRIDLVMHEVRDGDRRFDLTAREYALVARLAIAAGEAVSRADLFSDVWNLRFDPKSGVLDVHVSRLREKLGDQAWRIETVRGVGYRLRAADERDLTSA